MRAPYKKCLSVLSLLAFILICADSFSQKPANTIIKGTVVEAATGNPVPFASVFLKGTTVGTITNESGKYRIETNNPATILVVSFIGYQTEFRNIVPNKEQTINVSLIIVSTTLNEVVVKGNKKNYKNKNNPAVELIEKVIDHKDRNRQESYDFLEYRKYEKVQFALSNVTKNFAQRNPFHQFGFIFDNIDTTKRTGKSIVPLYIKESLSDYNYRKEPEATKEILLAEKTVNLDEYFSSKGISAYTNYLYQNINIYDNEILFLTNKFLSPIARTSPAFYRYYIIDTLSVDDIECIRLFFEPRNKSDFLFHGNMYITLDSTYAVKKIDLGMNKNINVDWVRDMNITQDFERSGQNSWLLSREEISIDFGVFKNSLGLYGQRTISLTDYKINEPIDKKVFRGPEKIEKIDIAAKQPDFWDSNRTVPLTTNENEIYTKIDSLTKIPEFRRKMNIVMLFTVGFLNMGNFEIGPVSSFYSYNSVEGSRFRLGGRTTTRFSKKVTLDGYLAYGLKDEILKYNAGITYSLTPQTIYDFPVRSIRVSLQKDTKIPGQELQFNQDDNFLLSFKRGINDKIYLNNTFRIEYLHEYINHFSWLAGYSYTIQETKGNLYFNPEEYGPYPGEVQYINISEPYLNLRYAPNESFYQGKLYRTVYYNKYPIMQLKIAAGPKFLNNDYNYLRLQFAVSKRFYVSILGYTDISIEAGKIFGQVSYPLLFIHRANQTYAYQKYSYNLMNFLEFVSDQYASLNIDHCFNGFIFNKIPLVKKLKLREVITFKAVYGRLSNSNNPDYQSNLFKFPVDSNGIPLTYSLDSRPYIEGGIGVSNILNIFRVDLIKRFSYQSNPNVDIWGFRLQFRIDI
jgi:hypothetical protein